MMFRQVASVSGQSLTGRQLLRDDRMREHSIALADQRAVTRDQLPGILPCQPIITPTTPLSKEAQMIAIPTSTEIRAKNRGHFRKGHDPRRRRFSREECQANF
jgi:hypothetical protein